MQNEEKKKENKYAGIGVNSCLNLDIFILQESDND